MDNIEFDALAFMQQKKRLLKTNQIDLHEYARALRSVWLRPDEIEDLKDKKQAKYREK